MRIGKFFLNGMLEFKKLISQVKKNDLKRFFSFNKNSRDFFFSGGDFGVNFGKCL